MKNFKFFLKRYPLIMFFGLAYSLSWGNYILTNTNLNIPFLFPYGPLLAALITAAVTGSLKDFARRCLRWRVSLKWYAGALLVPTFIGLVAIGLSILLGGPAPDAARIGPWYSLILFFPMAFVDAPLGEDSGWRGFALPRFSDNRLPLFNTLILALLVVGWHVPLVLSEPAFIAPYLTAGIASAVLTNWIYYNTHGSALMAILYHSAANAVGLYYAPMLVSGDQARYYWMLAVVNWVAAVAIILLAGPTLQRQPEIHLESVPVRKSTTAR